MIAVYVVMTYLGLPEEDMHGQINNITEAWLASL